MKKFYYPLIAIVIFASSCKTLGSLGIKPSHLETVMALKGILDSSTFKAIKTLKNLSDDGGTSMLPKEVNGVLKTLKTIGYGDEIDKATKAIGSSSKIVLSESEGIIGDAIKELKFSDAVAVVLGGEDAATNVLKRAMYGTVKKRYSERLGAELGKTEALDYWTLAAQAYNLFSKNKIESTLPDFLAERAVDALFISIGKEEAKARTDYQAIGNKVVTKVFDYYSKNKGKQ